MTIYKALLILSKKDKIRTKKDKIEVSYMTEHEKILLFSYIYNNTCELENDVKQLQSNVRYRRIDTADCMELMTALVRLETFREVSEHILLILRGEL